MKNRSRHQSSSDDEAFELIDGIIPARSSSKSTNCTKNAEYETTIREQQEEIRRLQSLIEHKDKIANSTAVPSDTIVQQQKATAAWANLKMCAFAGLALGLCLLISDLRAPTPPATLAEEMAGRVSFRSEFGSYLCAWKRDDGTNAWYFGFGSYKRTMDEWTIEAHGSKVAVRIQRNDASALLGSHYNGSVGTFDVATPTWETLWRPVKHIDGRWSLKSARGPWLRIKPEPRGGASLELQKEHNPYQQMFRLERF